MNYKFNSKNVSISYDDIRHGTHATVYKGEITTTSHEKVHYLLLSKTLPIVMGCQVALKQLRDCSYFNEDGIVKFWKVERLHEYVAVAQGLDHPNICKVIGLAQGQGLGPLLVLPYFPHHDIVKYLKKHSDKNEKDKMMLVVQILKALVYLHAKGVAHGCLHSGNILVDDSGSAVVSDVEFDSLMFSDDEYFPVHPKCWWMSRERLMVDDVDADELALGPASRQADVYAVALTIIQLWTLQRPFYRIRNKFKFVMMLRTLTTDELVNLALPEEVPPYVSAVLRGCLSNDPHARPTAETLLASFEALVDSL